MIITAELYKHFLQHPQICTDTRKLTPGCLFFALKGGNFNGNLFAVQALEQGAAFAVVDEDIDPGNPRLLRVDDVLKSLQDLATHHRRALNIPVLAITGSNGKTTTKELTAAVLKKKFNCYYTQGNLNNHIGVPLTLLSLTREHQFAVVEMGANHQKEIELLCRIAEPDFGLITNIGKAHLEGFGGIEGVKKGKGELYAFLKANKRLIFYCATESHLSELAGDYQPVISYGGAADQVQGKALFNGEFLQVNLTQPSTLSIPTQLTGDYNLPNVLCAITVGLHFGVPLAAIADAISAYSPDNQRSQVIQVKGMQVVLDAYNANPSSMAAALNNFALAFPKPRYLALGEMLELGESSAEEHKRIFALAKSTEPAAILLVGNQFEPFFREENVHGFIDSVSAAAWLKNHLPEKAAMLIKGSRGSKMEKLMEAFQA